MTITLGDKVRDNKYHIPKEVKLSEVRANLKNIRKVKVKSQVVEVKDDDSKIVTAVSFEYDGEPSEIEGILLLETQGRPLNAELYSPQAAMVLD